MEEVNIEINQVVRESFSKHSIISTKTISELCFTHFLMLKPGYFQRILLFSSFSRNMWSPGTALTQMVNAQHHFSCLMGRR